MKQVASLRYEVIFKKAFCEPDIFSAFVKDFLGIDLEIDKVETEKRFLEPIGKIDTRFDLFAEDKKNRIIVDIQHVRYEDHYDRFLHYHCAALLEQVSQAKNYLPSMTVFTIVVLTSGDKHKKDMLITDFSPKDLQGNTLSETPHKILYLCPKYVGDATPEPYQEWLRAIQDSLDEEVDETAYSNKTIQKVFRLIEQDGLTPQERFQMKDEYAMEQIQNNKLLTAARNMLLDNVAPELVAKYTGLSLEEITNL